MNDNLATSFWQVTADCRAVGEPITWQKMAAAAIGRGARNPGHTPDDLAALLRTAYLDQAQDGPVVRIDWAALADAAHAAGWKGRENDLERRRHTDSETEKQRKRRELARKHSGRERERRRERQSA